MRALLDIQGVDASYGQGRVLEGVTLTVEAGELVGVLGPNGAGKTTLARVVAGLMPMTMGTVTFGGQSIGALAPERRAWLGIAHVPQGRRVFPDLAVEENLSVSAFAARKRPGPSTRDFVDEVFPRLRDLTDRPAGLLSGGEQQMLAVARALLCQPRLIVLDEPSLGLAPAVVTEMYRAFVRIKSLGVAILLAEQAVSAVLAIADRAALLEAGRVVTVAAPERLRTEADLAGSYLGGSWAEEMRTSRTRGSGCTGRRGGGRP